MPGQVALFWPYAAALLQAMAGTLDPSGAMSALPAAAAEGYLASSPFTTLHVKHHT
jgi:hypothetical protein